MRIGYQRNGSDKYSRFTAVILAAGLSSRMKDFKPLLPVDGRTAIEGLVEAAKGAGIEKIIVVTGHERERLQPVIRRHELIEAYNPDFKDGMFTSVRTGLREAVSQNAGSGTCRGVLLMPVDCPLIGISVLRSLMDHAAAGPEDAPADFAVPVYEGKKGHPLFIPAGFVPEITAYDGQDGLKAITDKYWDRMDRVPVNEEGCIMDMDTPEGYDSIVRFVEMGFERTKLSVITAGRRFILVRHGQTRQHAEPMFIGQYDVPLDDEGRAQMRKAGEEIAELLQKHYAEDAKTDFFGNVIEKDMPDWSNTVFCSDLDRAAESAGILARALKEGGAMVEDEENGIFPSGVRVEPLKGLREIDLGSWDGRPIREVKEEQPEEYSRRGKDIFTFKTGNKSENFYDLQYRVMNSLRQILAADDGKNVIIVAHSGAIRALENNIKGLRVDDDWQSVGKGQYVEVEGGVKV